MVALGGGADSQAVLDLTIRYRSEHPQHRYMAIHLDHAFHPKSPQWAEFLRQQCIEHDIEHIIEPIEVPIEGRQSKEAQGRLMRYQGLAARTDPNAVILLGHHLSDQSETFLLQLKRGSGPKGLAAMAALAPFVGQRLLCRPLLGHSKDEIYLYAKTRQLVWIEDDTNVDTLFERNFLRHDVLPVLIKRWPKFEQTVARSARLCAEQQGLLDELLAEELRRRTHIPATRGTGTQATANQAITNQAITNEGGTNEGDASQGDTNQGDANRGTAMDLAELTTGSVAFQRALIRLFVGQQGAPMPSEAQLQEVIKQLQGQRVQVRFGAWQLASFNGYLHLLPVFEDVSDFRWQGQAQPNTSGCIGLPDELGELAFHLSDSDAQSAQTPHNVAPNSASHAPQALVAYLKVPKNASIQVGFCQPGNTMSRRAGGTRHSVARLLKKARVAPWWRQRLPAIWINGELAWVYELGQNGAFTVDGEAVTLTVDWQRGPKAPTK